MKFIKVRRWTWKHSFSGDQVIFTEESVTEQQVKSWIGQETSRGGSGNYKDETLQSKVVSVKKNRVTLTRI